MCMGSGDCCLSLSCNDISISCSYVIVLAYAPTYSSCCITFEREANVGKEYCCRGVSVDRRYTLFYNDILGPMGFMIRDSIIDIPAQFYHSWRLYWVVCYLYEMFWRWGIPSVIILLGYTIWIKWLKE